MTTYMPSACRLVAYSQVGLGLFNSFLVDLCDLLVPQQDNDLRYRASEFEGYVVVLADWRTGVFADVERLVRRNAERNCPGKLHLVYLLSVHRKCGEAAFAKTAAIVFEVE